LNINFLANPKPRDLAAKVGFVRLRARLAMGEVEILSGGLPEMTPTPRPARALTTVCGIMIPQPHLADFS
jgi:hypothetical protein